MLNTWLASVIMYSYNLNRKKNKVEKKISGVRIFKDFDIIKKKFMRSLFLLLRKIRIFFYEKREYFHKKKDINLNDINKKEI